MLKTSVIFIIFKRPVETTRVFEEIRKARPPKLFIVADGPRNDEEKKLTDATRAVVNNVDWPCEVEKNYAETNLGCRQRVWSGLNWAFDKLPNETDGAIILEDDCLPDPSFFSYCEEMLGRYKNDTQVMHIAGVHFQNRSTPESYYFSHIAQIWGWATWKRAWKLYDGSMETWLQKHALSHLKRVFPNRVTFHYWRHMFDRMHAGELDTWDVAWTYTVFKERGLCIMPRVNLIENIGSSAHATHKASQFMHQKTSPLTFPLIHPQKKKVNKSADLVTYKKIYGIRNSFRNALVAWTKDNLPFLFNHIQRLVR